MKWVSYISPTGSDRIGVVHAGEVYACPLADDLLELLTRGGSALDEAARAAKTSPVEVLPLTSVTVRAPLPVPPSIRDFMAFEDHIVPILAARGATVDPAWYEIPAFYFTNPAATLGPHDDVIAAPGALDLDYELEIAAVIGARGSNLTPDEGDALIAGFILLSDWSARDLQRRERGIFLGPTKGKDWATTFGPVFVTRDEFEPLRSGKGFNIRMTAEVNGVAYSDGNLQDLYWSFGEMVAYASRATELRPGDIIGSGTVGTGCIADLAARHGQEKFPWLKPGDRITLHADLLGSIDVVLKPAPPVIPLRAN